MGPQTRAAISAFQAHTGPSDEESKDALDEIIRTTPSDDEQ
jgi:hypothetical protein